MKKRRPAVPRLSPQEDDKKDSIYAVTESILDWIEENHITNEKGEPVTFEKHQFLMDIYEDQAQNLVVKKPAQVGLSLLEVLKNIHDAKLNRMDIIYTLPTDADVNTFVGGKVNRVIANNPCLKKLTEDSDSIEKKAIGRSMVYFRGTWTKKAAIMVTADRLVHDEKDSSKQDVVKDYQARLQHSKFNQTHVFSHPSVPGNGVDVEWQLSDQKEWFITCPHCGKSQILTWNTEEPAKMSIDIEKREFVCKKCHGVLDWHARAKGEWRKKKGKESAKWSGYHISLLMAPWISASYIIDQYNEALIGKQTMDFFWNKILGEPYAGGGNSVSEDMILGSVMNEKIIPKGRMVIGVDTGIKLRFVYGTQQGLMGYGEMTDYMPDDVNKLPLHKTLEYFLKSFPDCIMVIDQGGDIIGSRKLRAKYPGRVFLCHYLRDRKTMQLIKWGENDETGNVQADRNRVLQMVVDHFGDKRIPLYNGDRNDWYNYWLHWSHIYRVVEEDTLGVKHYVWLRNDRDDWCHATVYWYIGVSRFGGKGAIYIPQAEDVVEGESYEIDPDQSVSFNPDKVFGKKMPQEQPEEEPWWIEEDYSDDN